jgi:ribonuclease E
LTTYVSLAGRFIVLKPNKSRSGGVSRRIVGSDRDLARKSLSSIEVPKGMSVILRTAGIDRSPEELAWDLENLLTIWHAILNVVLERQSPFLIYRESNSVVRALRDYLTTEIGEILIDDDKTYREAHEFVEQVMPHNLRKLKHYEDKVPLFTRFQIESQIESAFTHSVNLPSGGSVVIDHTEALVSIDINSARATKGGDIEATALNTNLEAADEIGRQLRIRDLGGLIVIDFIDMGPQKHQREVENRLREAVRQDRARVQIGKISRFGLLEMSRQRLRPSLGESSYLTCPRCSGIGTIRSIESLALAILRIIGEEARKERTAKVIAQLPVEVATYLLNEKRDWVQNLESSNEMQVVLVANPALETPHYEVRRVRDDQTELPENAGASYALAEAAPEPESPQAILERKAVEPAAIAVLKPSKPAPKRKKPKAGLLSRIAELFSGGDSKKAAKKKKPVRRKKTARKDGRAKSKQQRGKTKRDSHRTDEPRPASKKRSKKKSSKKKAPRKTAVRKKTQPGKEQNQSQTAEKETRGDALNTEERKPTRSRRSRGGRRRRRSSEKPRTGGAETTSGNASKAAAPEGASPDQRPDDRPPAKAEAPSKTAPVDAARDAAGKAAPPERPDAKRIKDAGSEVSRDAGPDRTDAGVAASATVSGPAVKDQPSASVTQTSASEAPAEKSKPPADIRDQAEKTPEVKSASTPAAEPQVEPAEQRKPEGRLLPWEPAKSTAAPEDGKKPEAKSDD